MIGPGVLSRCRAKTLSSAGDVQALADSESRDIADAVGASNLLGGHAVAKTDSVEILAGFDVMDYAGPARSRTRATQPSQHGHEHNEAERNQ